MKSITLFVPRVAKRQLIHQRQVDLMAYLRDDGMWDLEATLSDRKTRTFEGGARDIVAGEAIHGMRLALTVDTGGTIAGVSVTMDAVPYAESCTAAGAVYQLLNGLNLFAGFRDALNERIGKLSRCSHVSEMAALLPTLAIQSFAGVVYPVRDDPAQTDRGQAIDQCRGLRADGEAVRQYFPRWYRKAAG